VGTYLIVKVSLGVKSRSYRRNKISFTSSKCPKDVSIAQFSFT